MPQNPKTRKNIKKVQLFFYNYLFTGFSGFPFYNYIYKNTFYIHKNQAQFTRFFYFDYFFHVFIPKHLKKGAVMNRLVAVAQLAVCFVLVFCINSNGQNHPKELVGRWMREVYGGTRIEHAELFQNGKLVWDDWSRWEVMGERRLLVSGSDGNDVFDYEISGYKLILVDNAGKTIIFGTYPFNSAKILPLCNKTVEKSLLTGRNPLCCIRCYKVMAILLKLLKM
jgi:uncharacterized protein with PQ loop repeat